MFAFDRIAYFLVNWTQDQGMESQEGCFLILSDIWSSFYLSKIDEKTTKSWMYWECHLVVEELNLQLKTNSSYENI